MPFKDLPEISKKQSEIIDMVWQFRFINRHQMQKFFKYKSPRRLNEWLGDLVDKGYLGRIYSRKLLENTKPSIYYLMNNAILHCRWNKSNNDPIESKDVKKFYEDKHASQTFISHSINVCTLYQQIKNLTNNTWEYDCWTKNELWTTEITSHPRNTQITYLPDLCMERTKKTDDEYIYETFVIELFDYYMPKYALEGKVKRYIELLTSKDSGYFFHDEDEQLTIMLILPTQRKATRLKKYIEDQLIYERNLDYVTFKLTSFDKVLKYGIDAKNIWKTVNEDEEN